MAPSPLRRDWIAALAASAAGVGLLLLWRSAWMLLAWRVSGLHLDLASFTQHRAALEAWVQAAPGFPAAVFFCLYVAVCALCLPGTLTLVVVAGALFGGWWGALLALPAAVLGSLGAFHLSRGFLSGWVRRAFPDVVASVDRGLAREGDWFVLTVRLLPLSSFSLVNLGMGVSAIRPARFAGLSAVGLAPGFFAYAWTGQHLEQLHQVRDLLDPGLWFSLLALALLPLATRLALGWWRRRRSS